MTDVNKIPGQTQGDQVAGGPTGTDTTPGDNSWIKLARDAYKRSTTYMENNYQKTFEDGLRMFNSQHPRDSKYNSDAYKYRSRVFRPKTRSVIRKHEATAAVGMFSNPDVLTVDPQDYENEEQQVSAKINKELLQYRLTKSIPWFITAIGAFQDAMVMGICCSFQYWDYQARDGKVLVDKPCIELIPPNKVRFDPAAKWYDVVGTSPYVILELPMYLRDVLDRMELGYGKDQSPWHTLDEKVLLNARVTENDPVQQAREGRREDPNQVRSEVNEFDVVMVHLNFIKTEDGCFTYYTLKDTHLLSDPIPVEDAFLHGEIPITIGFCVLETHQALPKGLTQIGAQLQQEANEIANQRLDNVKFVLNKRWIVKRGSNIDVENMLRNVPGGIVMANDVEKDVKELVWNDVTASSFQEQDRLNADFDDLEGGGLNSSSVMTNRKLNETVGGMKMMQQGSNSLTEYTFRVWIETWVEPTLRQLAKLEQWYESDEVVLAMAASRSGQMQKFRMSPDLDRLLKQDLTITINVGMGATDPEARLQKFLQACGMYTQMAHQAPPDMNLMEFRKEIFGLSGFKDSNRFFTKVDPRVMQARQMMQQAEGIATKLIDQHKDRMQRRERLLDEREHQMGSEMVQAQTEFAARMRELSQEFALKQREQQFDFQAQTRKNQQELGLARQRAQQEANIKWFEANVDAAIAKFEAVSRAKAQAEAAKHAPKKPNGSGDSVH